MVVIRAKKVKAVIEEKTGGEILSLEKAGEAHRHARKEQKLRKVQKAFKEVLSQKVKRDRIASGKKTKNKRKKK